MEVRWLDNQHERQEFADSLGQDISGLNPCQEEYHSVYQLLMEPLGLGDWGPISSNV